jgi:predicted nucleotidyltransferase
MTRSGLSEHEWDLIKRVISRHTEVKGVILYGSRAKGTAVAASDIDLAVEGIEDPLRAESLAGELEELPLPYRFDVKALSAIQSRPLLEHIRRVGVRIY